MPRMTGTSGIFHPLLGLKSSPVCVAVFSSPRECHLLGLELPANAGSLVQTSFLDVDCVGEYHETQERLASTQASVEELEAEVSRLPKPLRWLRHWEESLHVFKGSFPGLLHQISLIYRCCRPEPMTIWIGFMPQFTIIFVYTCYWTWTSRSAKASSVSSRIFLFVLVLIQVWLILRGHLIIWTCPMRMRHVCDRSCPNFWRAFAAMVPYITLTLKRNLGRTIPV